MADDQQALSIGVILSGMGSDGTEGLRAIKANGGSVFVQDPATTEYSAMPSSAIETRLADMIGSPGEVAAKIAARGNKASIPTKEAEGAISEKALRSVNKVLLVLRSQLGHDFSLYKKSTLYRRIARRMEQHQIEKIEDYVRYLQANTQETELLFKEMLIGVTNFFRDTDVWESLRADAMPSLLSAYPAGVILRAWVAGCSTGEEAYSRAITFREMIDQFNHDNPKAASYTLQIFATDLDKESIDTARIGLYPASIAEDVSEQRLQRFFDEETKGYRVIKEIRDMVIFAPQNLVMDPPFTKLDLITCRNLLIYLEGGLQKKLMRLFHYSLNPSGFLMLGKSETVGNNTELFASLASKLRLYQRQDVDRQSELFSFDESFTQNSTDLGSVIAHLPTLLTTLPQSSINLQALTDSLLLQRFSPSAVLTTREGDIVYISGKTGKYLEPATGRANLNVFAMAREGLAGALQVAFNQTLRQRATNTLENISVGTNGGTQRISVTLEFLAEPIALRGMVLIVFTDLITPVAATATGEHKTKDSLLASMEKALGQAHDELQITREEMQSSQEELKAANDELLATNEELQGNNEEMTTSKEEMQSLNEEMQTVNHELLAKVSELEYASDDMKNLLNATEVATLFIDGKLKVRRFTANTIKIFNLIPSDVGRSTTDLYSNLDYPQMPEDVDQVLTTLVSHERQVISHDGRWYRVRIMPYRTNDNQINGAVITFINITEIKELEISLQNALTFLQDSFTNQTAQLDIAQLLEATLNKTQAALQKRYNEQNEALEQSQHDLKTEQGKRL
ncbi:MAG: two-component system CheB/CheR fusion protein [Candidatus Azotimanducaceae bacterium]